jgi:probable phosphoglycerate mutase
MTELVLVRHGLTAWNRETRFQGPIDIPLDPEGHEEAERAAQALAEQALAAPVSAVYSSDLTRARQTAEPIARRLGLPVRVDPAMRERHYGAFEGLTPEELQRDWGPAFARWRGRELDFALPGGGESLRGFHDRVLAAIEAMAARHPGERVVAVTHGGVLDSIYRIASGLAADEPRRFELNNASINRIGWNGEQFSVLGWGDVSHLAKMSI